MLTNEEIKKSYKVLIRLLKERDDERINTVNEEEFKNIYIENLKKQYEEDERTEDFYTYVEDNIYEDVCNE